MDSRQRHRRLGLVRLVAVLTLLLTLLLAALHASASSPRPDAAGLLFNAPQHARAGLLHEVLSPRPGGRSSAGGSLMDVCRPTGHIEDAQCDYETVEAINADFFSRLQEIVHHRYFRYYKVDLYKDCPFWVDNSLCKNRDCTVQRAEESEIPIEYRSASLSTVASTPQHEVHDGADQCSCQEADFCHWDDENSDEAVYVDLLRNPERFTGYAGPSANRVWKSIYEENCFGAATSFTEPPRDKSSGGGSGFPHLGPESGLLGASPASAGLASLVSSLQAPVDPGDSEVCLEKRIFYRIISGLHASISIHICNEYLDQRTGVWGPNLDCFIARIAQHPERLQNVYFNYVLLLRALARAAQFGGGTSKSKQRVGFNMLPGHEIDDARTSDQLNYLLRSAASIPTTFDEHSMFAGPDARGLKEEFKAKFRNVTTIMDCVGCDKCRLWGKVQTSGLATALKILFSYEDDARQHAPLLRSELVALINTAHRFAESLHAVEVFRSMYQKELEEEGKADAPAAAPPSSTLSEVPLGSSSAPPPPSRSASQRIGGDGVRTTDSQSRSRALDSPSADKGWTMWLQRVTEGLQRLLRTCQQSMDSCLRWVKSGVQERLRNEL